MLYWTLENQTQALIREFGDSCAYCESPFSVSEFGKIDYFYPKSTYPEKELMAENILPVCCACSLNKADNFPLDENGMPLLLHPRIDTFDEHIHVDSTGKLLGKTKRGRCTIETLQLNRYDLIESRKIKRIEREYHANICEGNCKKPYTVFKENIKKVKELHDKSLLNANGTAQYFSEILYSHTVDILQAYLCDALVLKVSTHKPSLRNFISSFQDFRKTKFELNDIFAEFEDIENKATFAIRGLAYDDLPKISKIYKDTLGIEFSEISEIYKHILIKHDLLHRNGKPKEDKRHNITQPMVRSLCEKVERFIDKLQQSIDAIK